MLTSAAAGSDISKLMEEQAREHASDKLAENGENYQYAVVYATSYTVRLSNRSSSTTNHLQIFQSGGSSWQLNQEGKDQKGICPTANFSTDTLGQFVQSAHPL